MDLNLRRSRYKKTNGFIVNLRYAGLGYNRGLEPVVPLYPPLSLAEIFAAVGD